MDSNPQCSQIDQFGHVDGLRTAASKCRREINTINELSEKRVRGGEEQSGQPLESDLTQPVSHSSYCTMSRQTDIRNRPIEVIDLTSSFGSENGFSDEHNQVIQNVTAQDIASATLHPEIQGEAVTINNHEEESTVAQVRFQQTREDSIQPWSECRTHCVPLDGRPTATQSRNAQDNTLQNSITHMNNYISSMAELANTDSHNIQVHTPLSDDHTCSIDSYNSRSNFQPSRVHTNDSQLYTGESFNTTPTEHQVSCYQYLHCYISDQNLPDTQAVSINTHPLEASSSHYKSTPQRAINSINSINSYFPTTKPLAGINAHLAHQSSREQICHCPDQRLPCFHNIISSDLLDKEQHIRQSNNEALSSPRDLSRNQDFEIAPPEEQNIQSSECIAQLLSTNYSPSLIQNSEQPFSKSTHQSDNSHLSPPDLNLPKQPTNILSCPSRKRIIASPNRPQILTTAMKTFLHKTNLLLDPFRSPDTCWFHPSPPPAVPSPSGIPKPAGKLTRLFTWSTPLGRHTLVLNHGICHKLISRTLSKTQLEGWINNQWHLSHLCGNWSCVNPDHATVEPGGVNIGRNSCFAHRDRCMHRPACMKGFKVALGKDGRLGGWREGGRGLEYEAKERVRRAYFWREWWAWGMDCDEMGVVDLIDLVDDEDDGIGEMEGVINLTGDDNEDL